MQLQYMLIFLHISNGGNLINPACLGGILMMGAGALSDIEIVMKGGRRGDTGIKGLLGVRAPDKGDGGCFKILAGEL